MNEILKSYALVFLFLLVAIASYFFGSFITERKFELAIAKQSLIDISRNTQLLELGEGTISAQFRKTINVNIARHILNVMNDSAYELDESEKKYKKGVFIRLNRVWSKYQPFSEEEFQNHESLEYLQNTADYVGQFKLHQPN